MPEEPVERRPHPSYDRATTRRVLAWCAAAALSALGGTLAHRAGAGAWSGFGLAGFFVALGGVCFTPVNRYPCPTCGERLVREPFTTEFTCTRCEIVWVTRSFGENFFE